MSQKVFLSPNQLRAIQALLTVGTVRAAAQATGISAKQLHRWLGDDDFRQGLQDAQERAVQAHVTALIAQLADNRAAMVALRDGAQHESTRLRASIAIDDSLVKWRSIAEFEQRLARLEREIASET